MASLAKHQQKESTESTAWMTSLAQSIDLIGTEHFTDSLIRSVKVIANIDYAQAYAFYQNERPVCLFHTFSPEKRIVYVDDYIKGPYLLDPFSRLARAKSTQDYIGFAILHLIVFIRVNITDLITIKPVYLMKSATHSILIKASQLLFHYFAQEIVPDLRLGNFAS